MNHFSALTIRPARQNDALLIAAMSRDLIETGLDWRYRPKRITAMINDADMIVLVAESDASMGGFAAMQFGDEHGHLSLLAVQPSRQRRRVATSMLNWLLASARVAGLASIGVELRTENQSALDFYVRQGFVETTLLPDYYGSGIGARRMNLQLRRA
ncbi:MAG: N-acetyltransferase [Ideonella sp.]